MFGSVATSVLIAALGVLTSALGQMLLLRAALVAQERVRRQLFVRLLRLDAAYHSRHGVGDLLSRSDADLRRAFLLVGPIPLLLVSSLSSGAVGVAGMTVIDPWITFLVLIPAVILVVSMAVLGRWQWRAQERAQHAVGEIASQVHETLVAVPLLRGISAEGERIRRLDRASQVLRTRAVRLGLTTALGSTIVTVVAPLAVVLLVWHGTAALASGALGVGDVFAFFAYIGIAIAPAAALGSTLSNSQRALAAFDRVRELLEARSRFAHEFPVASLPRELPPSAAIDVCGLQVRQADGTRILEGIDVRIPVGAHLLLTGPTGSGKTIFLRALAGLWPIDGGSICIGGYEMKQLRVRGVRRAVSFVSQTPTLFAGTLLENLLLARSGASRAEVSAALDIAALGDELGDRLDAPVGRHGSLLSGGQRARVALARCILRDSPVVLLDDFLAAIDEGNQHRLLTRLDGWLRGRTVVWVTHRLSAVAPRVGHVAVLDRSALRVYDGHAEAERENSWYAAAFRAERGEHEH